MKKTTTLTIDIDVLAQFKKLVPNMSAAVEGFMQRSLAEKGISGEQKEFCLTRQEYANLRMDAIKKNRQVADEEAYLRKTHKFEMLYATAKQEGLDWDDLGNLDDCKPKLLKAWNGSSSVMNEFITYLEWWQERQELERRLDDVRHGKIKVAVVSDEKLVKVVDAGVKRSEVVEATVAA